MLEISKQKKTASSLNSCDSHLLQELTPDETSLFTGGFSIKNETNKPVTFYLLNPNADPQKQLLSPGSQGSYNDTYLLYDSLVGDPYKPIVKELDNNGNYRFSPNGDQIDIVGAAQNFQK